MRLLKGFTASILIHVFIFLSCYYMIIWWKNSDLSAVDIDLTSSTLMLRPSKATAKSAQPEITVQDWYLSDSKQLPPKPVLTSQTEAAEQPAIAECPAPCPDNTSDWATAGSTTRRPVWSEGFITEDDYPKEARAQGREGKVKVEVFIDATGRVRDARVIESTDGRFTAVVLDKLKKAKFEPALDKSGNPVAVHMAMPIVFELR